MNDQIDVPEHKLLEALSVGQKGYYLRPFNLSNEDVYALVRMDDEHLNNPFWGLQPEYKWQSFLGKCDFVRDEIRSFQQTNGRDLNFGIFERNAFHDRLVGQVCARRIDCAYLGIDEAGNKEAQSAQGYELGMCLRRTANKAALYHKQGLALAVLDTLLTEIKKKTGNVVIFVRVQKDNLPSLKCCEKCGFVQPIQLESFGDKQCSDVFLMKRGIDHVLISIQNWMRQKRSLKQKEGEVKKSCLADQKETINKQIEQEQRLHNQKTIKNGRNILSKRINDGR